MDVAEHVGWRLEQQLSFASNIYTNFPDVPLADVAELVQSYIQQLEDLEEVMTVTPIRYNRQGVERVGDEILTVLTRHLSPQQVEIITEEDKTYD